MASKNFSIYLLKQGYNANNSLKDEHELLELEEENTRLPEGSVMYLSNNRVRQPWWKSYWGVTQSINQASNGAIVFIPVDDRWVALTFGMTYHKLKDTCYEYDFGVKTTLNSLDPDKIKSTDILSPENAKRQRIQMPNAANLNYFDIQHDESIIKRLTGAVKDEYSELFRNVTGANSLKLSTKLLANEIVGLCRRVIEIYNLNDYNESFPEINNIIPVKDPAKLDLLNCKLQEAFIQAPVDLVLTIPEIVDHEVNYKYKFSGAGRSDEEYDGVFIGRYRDYLDEKGVDIDDSILAKFHKHFLNTIDENGITKASYSIYKCFLFECVIEDNLYHLCDGEWYQVKSDYIQKLSEEINPYFSELNIFTPRTTETTKESQYNSVISNAIGAKCLDMTNIAPNGHTQVEPCDIMYKQNDMLDLIHVKISTRSSSLSHLFNQGVNSVELLRMVPESKEKLKTLVDDADYNELIDNETFRVVYGIITKKFNANIDDKAKNLPLFSRISLLRTIHILKMMGVSVVVSYIEDNI